MSDVQVSSQASAGRLVLKYKFDCNSDPVAVAIIPYEGIILGCNDRSLSVLLKRESGIHWPAVNIMLPSSVSCLEYLSESQKLYAGQCNGTISEFSISEDYNQLEHQRDYLSHIAPVTAVKYVPLCGWIASCSKDRYFSWYSTDTARKCGSYLLEGKGLCMEYDYGSNNAFIGIDTGCIVMVRVKSTSCDVVHNFRYHSDAVQALAWDPALNRLFSGAADHSAIVWEVGGCEGKVNELRWHSKDITGLFWCASKNAVITTSTDAHIGFWLMSVNRIEAPQWQESDCCQVENCGMAFLWNFKKMWKSKAVGSRQHHCRKCGLAVCENCSNFESAYPIMGFEKPVRMCKKCIGSVLEQDLKHLAAFYNSKHVIKGASIDEKTMTLLTFGKDKQIKAWDINSLIVQ